MEIKPISESDIAALSALATKTFTETFGHGFAPDELEHQLKETRSEKYFTKALKEDSFLGAYERERLIGYVQFGDIKVDVIGDLAKRGDKAINALYIYSDFQGMGVGKALMNAALAHDEFREQAHAFVDVWDQNKRAYAFYKKYGFKDCGQCAVYVDDKIVGYDLVLKIDL